MIDNPPLLRIIIALALVLLNLGLATRLDAWRMTHEARDYGCLERCVVSAVVALLLLIAMLVMLALPVLDNNYYDYLLLTFALFMLMALWGPALLGAAVIRRVADLRRSGSAAGLRSSILLVAVLLIVALTASYLSSRFTDTMLGLALGPQQAQGVVQDKQVIGGRSVAKFIVVDGRSYEATNWAWFETLHVGQRLAFLRDPAATVAFIPGAVGPTPPALAAAALAAMLLILTALAAISGLWQTAVFLTRPGRRL